MAKVDRRAAFGKGGTVLRTRYLVRFLLGRGWGNVLVYINRFMTHRIHTHGAANSCLKTTSSAVCAQANVKRGPERDDCGMVKCTRGCPCVCRVAHNIMLFIDRCRRPSQARFLRFALYYEHCCLFLIVTSVTSPNLVRDLGQCKWYPALRESGIFACFVRC